MQPLLTLTRSEIRTAAAAAVKVLSRVDPAALYRAALDGRLGADARAQVGALTPTAFEALLRGVDQGSTVDSVAEAMAAALRSSGLVEVAETA